MSETILNLQGCKSIRVRPVPGRALPHMHISSKHPHRAVPFQNTIENYTKRITMKRLFPVFIAMLVCLSVQGQVSINKFSFTSNVQSGECIDYIIQYSCSSLTADCSGTLLTDTLPAGTTFEAATQAGSVLPDTMTLPDGRILISWDIDTLIAGSTAQVGVTVCTQPGVTLDGTLVINEASITDDFTIIPETSAADPVVVSSTPSWIINKTVPSGKIYHDDLVTYQIDICLDAPNPLIGTQNLDGVMLTDVLPAGAVFQGASPTPTAFRVRF